MKTMERQFAKIREAPQQERKEHELTKKALELFCRTTQQFHIVWNEVMANPLVIPNYRPESEAEPQLKIGVDEDERLHEELRQEEKARCWKKQNKSPQVPWKLQQNKKIVPQTRTTHGHRSNATHYSLCLTQGTPGRSRWKP